MADTVTITAENPYYNYVSGDSVIVPDTGSIRSQVNAEWQNAFGGTALSVNPATPQGRIIEMSVVARTGTLETCAFVANQINIKNATGQFLDGVASLFAVNRRGATKSYAACLCSGVPGTTIPAGSRVANTSGDIFVSQNDLTLGGNGSGTVYFYAEKTGAVPAALNTITAIITPVDGWETVVNNNAAAIFVGADKESDAVFRARVEKSRYSGAALLRSIDSKVRALDGVSGFALYENVTNVPQNIPNEDSTASSVNLDPHSICLIINGGNDKEIAQALFDTKSAGCGYTALDNSVTVDVAYEQRSYPVTFNRPAEVDVACQIRVKSNTYAGSNLAGDIRNAIVAWAAGEIPGVDGISIGTALSTFEIAAGISAQVPDVIINDVQIGLVGGTLGYGILAIDAGAVAALLAENITVYIDGVEAPAAGE